MSGISFDPWCWIDVTDVFLKSSAFFNFQNFLLVGCGLPNLIVSNIACFFLSLGRFNPEYSNFLIFFVTVLFYLFIIVCLLHSIEMLYISISWFLLIVLSSFFFIIYFAPSLGARRLFFPNFNRFALYCYSYLLVCHAYGSKWGTKNVRKEDIFNIVN